MTVTVLKAVKGKRVTTTTSISLVGGKRLTILELRAAIFSISASKLLYGQGLTYTLARYNFCLNTHLEAID